MIQLCLWTIIAASGLLVGALFAINVRTPRRFMDFSLIYTGEVLTTAVGFSLIDTARVLIGNLIIAAGLIAGALLVFIMTSQVERSSSISWRAGRSMLPLLGIQEVILNSPEFLAIGVGLSGGGLGAVFLLAVYMSNVVEAMRTTTALRQMGWWPFRLSVFWLAIGVCLITFAMISFVVFRGTTETFHAATQAIAAGGMLAALSTAEPSQDLSTGFLGFLTSLRFGLAFLIASAL